MRKKQQPDNTLWRLIDQLPLKYIYVVILRSQAGMRYTDIAARLGITAGCARWRYNQAQKLMRQIVDGRSIKL